MRDFLKGLDLDKDTIEAVMAEHGKYITGLKEQVEDYKEQIAGYENKMSELNGTIDELNNTINSNNETLENLKTLTEENTNLKADIQLGKSNVKSEFSDFVRTQVLSKVNEETDFATALEDYKKESPQYFGDTVVKKVQSSPTLNGGNPQPQTTNDIMNNILRGVRDDD